MKIALIGTGRAAWQLALGLRDRNDLHLYGRSIASLEAFKPCQFSNKELIQNFRPDALDLILICVSDEAISSVAAQLHGAESILIAHVSGSQPLDTLPSAYKRRAVFYPFRSVRKGEYSGFEQVPIFIEADHSADVELLHALALELGGKPIPAKSDQRACLHLAAVISHNLVNRLMTESALLLEKSGLSFDLLRPLLTAYCRDLMNTHPSDLQTGPASRGDRQIVDAHLEMLQHDLVLQRIYLDISSRIMQSSAHDQ